MFAITSFDPKIYNNKNKCDLNRIRCKITSAAETFEIVIYVYIFIIYHKHERYTTLWTALGLLCLKYLRGMNLFSSAVTVDCKVGNMKNATAIVLMWL